MHGLSGRGAQVPRGTRSAVCQEEAAILRPLRRSTVSSAPSTMGASGGTSSVMSHPSRIRRPWRADHVARFRTRWSCVKRHAAANPVARKVAVTVRAPGVSMAPRSQTWAGHQTRSEKSGANGANTSMISAGRCGIGRPPSRA